MKKNNEATRGRAAGERGTFECYLTYACNQRCVFCFTPGELRRSGTIPFARLAREIRAARRRGHTELSLLGGEPTAHPDIEKIVALARDLGFARVFTFSNGQRYADPAFAARMKEAGLFGSYLSIHGHTPALHDAVTGVPGSFRKAVAGVKNLLAAGVYPVLICVVQRRNARYLRQYAEYFSALGVSRYVMFGMKFQGRVVEEVLRARRFLIGAPQAAAAVRDLFGWFRARAAMPPLIEHFPPCLLPGFEERMTDYYPEARPRRDADYGCLHPGEGADSSLGRAYKDLVYLPGCSRCACRAGCQGIDANYLTVFGPAGFEPLPAAAPPFYAGWPARARAVARLRFQDLP